MVEFIFTKDTGRTPVILLISYLKLVYSADDSVVEIPWHSEISDLHDLKHLIIRTNVCLTSLIIVYLSLFSKQK